ncbi:MAG: carboxypeptidase regulatory-like domain-containing protein [Bacteroidales bacterium]|nr:carboxypeptidase regulatory-like domain-containing protein [Bacteroidales bacterium]MBR3714137.1 carboxypeptidase regulatory-like domain-containing protein [Bacteroidales bacterium]MBR4273085.1 carboxypeptidase regulatory-like domain-containing protein [Bacteroidales bacterium]
MIHTFIQKTAILTVVMLLIGLSALGQDHKVYEVRGTLVNTDGEVVQFAHVVNINRSSACISDTEGRFRMLMMRQDTVKISCLGYEITGFSIRNLNIDEDEHVVEIGDIELQPRLYELSTISVYAERWRSFLYDYEQVPIKEEPYYVKTIDTWKNNIIDVRELQELRRGTLGVGISFDPAARKRRKAEQKIAEFKRQEELNQAAYEKYNPSIVAELTGMSHEEATKFIEHFRLDRDFILSKNDYDLCLIINQLYKEYSKTQHN